MRLTCETASSDRRMPSLGQPCKVQTGWKRTSLSIGRSSGGGGACDVIHVLVCTAQNRSGFKYRVSAKPPNVRQVFNKFASEGRATISFEAPPQDLLIRKADPLQLRTFLKVLIASMTKTGGAGSDDGPVASTSTSKPKAITLGRLRAATASQMRSPKTKMAIKHRSSYPIGGQGFPSSLAVLCINQCSLKKFDWRILALKQLRELDVSDNCLSALPDELGAALPRLHSLNAARNNLVRLSASSLGRLLADVDLSHNRLEALPVEACANLELLHTLRVDNNRLAAMPERLHLWRNLRKLVASNNLLSCLPTGVLHLRLDSIDVTANPFNSLYTIASSDTPSSEVVPSLLELTARTVLRLKVKTEEQDLPRHLTAYLSEDKICPCGVRFVVGSDAIMRPLDLSLIASTIMGDVDGGTRVPFCLRLCSPACTKRFAG